MTAVSVVIVVLGVPAAVLAGIWAWNTQMSELETRTLTVSRAVERRLGEDGFVSQSLVAAWSRPIGREEAAYTVVVLPGRYEVISGRPPSKPSMTVEHKTADGVVISMQISAATTIRHVVFLETVLLAGILSSLAIAYYLASAMARRLSSPLIYLAAQAEQIGSGQVRAQVRPSGIEEIDLVQEELVRTGERMARRLAAERQRAADASHQLRTPLTALSMRLEEIQLFSGEEDIQYEAEVALGQVERLTEVVTELLDSSKRSHGETEVVQLLEVFNTELEEWEHQFEDAGRKLVFTDEAAQLVLAEEGKLTQILAVLIENSLKYGDGTTTVKARSGDRTRAIFIDVCDEGEGIDDDIAEEVFDQGFSGHGSSGIGLALAKDLAQGMGARLELTQRQPPVFTLSLSAIPGNFDPNVVMPEAPIISVGRRTRRF